MWEYYRLLVVPLLLLLGLCRGSPSRNSPRPGPNWGLRTILLAINRRNRTLGTQLKISLSHRCPQSNQKIGSHSDLSSGVYGPWNFPKSWPITRHLLFQYEGSVCVTSAIYSGKIDFWPHTVNLYNTSHFNKIKDLPCNQQKRRQIMAPASLAPFVCYLFLLLHVFWRLCKINCSLCYTLATHIDLFLVTSYCY